MVNSSLLLSGILMMIIGIIIPIYWWKTKKVPVKYFGFGAVVWILAILPKFILDITISPSLNDYLFGYGIEVTLILSGLYVGLRTGLFESGLTYLAAIKTELKDINFEKAVAFGIGFGCFETLIIGFFSFLSILPFVLKPELINELPTAQADLLKTQLNQSTLIVPAAIIERITTIIIHLFATLLVFYSIRVSLKKYLWYSIGFKGIVDGIIPALQYYIGFGTLSGAYIIELPFIGFGLIAFGGIKWIKNNWDGKDSGNEKI